MKNLEKITEEEEKRRGILITQILGLKKGKGGLYYLGGGFLGKSELGVFRVIKRLVLDGE